jgi:ribosomal protein L40E
MGRRRTTHWTCTRQQNGVRCGALNPHRKQKCGVCGKPKPRQKAPEHLKALDYDYDWYVEFQGGEFCGVCGFKPGPKRRLDRDHNHTTRVPRGLLCPNCNRRLWKSADAAWAQAVLVYLLRAEERWASLQG